MCGRYTLGKEPNSLLDYFHLHGDVPVYHLSYNIAPSQLAPVVLHNQDGQRVCQMMRWGLVPAWSKGPDPRFNMINARAETITQKPAYKTAFKTRRCLIPCDGFYEWQAPQAESEKQKQPFFIRRKDQQLMAMAGVWDHWQDENEPITSFSVITTIANSFMQRIHQRMPVMIEPDQIDAWLTNDITNPSQLTRLLLSRESDELQMYPVSRSVNSPKNDSIELLAPL